MLDFLQDCVSGLATGSIYAVLALGLTLIYQVSGIVNFAQGALAAVGVYVLWSLTYQWPFAAGGLPFWPAALLAVVVVFLLGVLLQTLFLRRLQRSPATAVIVTLGLFITLEGGIGLIWGQATPPTTLSLPFTPGLVTVGALTVSGLDLTAIGVTVVLMLAFFTFLRFTHAGASLRAVAQSARGARLVGIRVDRVRLAAWGIGAALAAVAGVLIATATFTQQSPTLADVYLLSAFAGAVIGGLDNLVGAAAGALLVGIVQSLVALYAPTALLPYKDGVVFALLLAVLFVRPAGLFGVAVQRRV